MRTLSIVGLAAGLLASLSIEANVNPASHVLVKREAPERIAFPKDGKNKDAITKSEQAILDATGLKEVYGFRTSEDDEFLHWVFKAEDPAVETIKKDPGIDTVIDNSEDEVGAAFPQPSPTARLPPNKVKRALEYATTTANPDLVFISQPKTVEILDDLENYIYEKKGGKGIRIYYVELGVTRMSAI